MPKPFHLGHIDMVGDYKPGDPRPEGYMDWHEWARVQTKAGLRQVRCGVCSKWKFPQELSAHPEGAVCLECHGERTGDPCPS